MRNLSILIILIFFSVPCSSQVLQKYDRPIDPQTRQDTLPTPKSKDFKPSNNTPKANIQDYKIIDFKNDTTVVDTTLSIQKFYKYNYLRKDNFELINFPNIGQTYNKLSKSFDRYSTLPIFGARARHFNYYEIEDTFYYYVPTPLTELMYKSALKEGQLLDAIFTVNPSRQLNLSIAYKGLRSLGRYQNSLTSTGNLRITTNYQSKNHKYLARAHMVTQDLSNDENGGLSDADILNFKNGDEEFKDREVFETQLDDAQNILVGKRFHLEHGYTLWKDKDSVAPKELIVSNIISFEDKFYRFEEGSASPDVFGPALTSVIRDKVTLEDFQTQLGITYNGSPIGELGINATYSDINYGYNKVVNLDSEIIRNRIKTGVFGVGANYAFNVGNFELMAKGQYNLSDELEGNLLQIQLDYKYADNLRFSGQISRSTQLPNYNQLLYQSDYREYNWDNYTLFNPVILNKFSTRISHSILGEIELSFDDIGNYTYFAADENNFIKPFQYQDQVSQFKVKAFKEFQLGKFGMVNTLMYQNVLEGTDVLNVPEFITRNTVYYKNEFFDKALLLQTGINFKYFTKYSMDGYDPLLADFYVQNADQFGGFPMFDAFVNAKIRQTRIYLVAEHFNSFITGYDYFSSPRYPFRDFSFRFGLVWNFFL